jgi:transcriptional regulator with XRE-family HTH domain
MVQVRKLPDDQRRALRITLQDAVEQGGSQWTETIRQMRQTLGLTQEQFAKAFRLTKRQVVSLEAGTANPTVRTLARIGRPFGFQVGYIRREQERARRPKDLGDGQADSLT